MTLTPSIDLTIRYFNKVSGPITRLTRILEDIDVYLHGCHSETWRKRFSIELNRRNELNRS